MIIFKTVNHYSIHNVSAMTSKTALSVLTMMITFLLVFDLTVYNSFELLSI